ncbi:MAG: DUF3352 domain-containing protein [Tildeniella nuda ZEHNDER 1965/U140]|jgi:hypothetical protein|nr:DUF3352 domain-containing protein [Tildeniella nuda ZEHNDER 1965/U140]
MIKKKKPSLLLPLGAAVLLVGGGGAAYWALTQGGIGSGDLPVGAEVIPQDALMTLSVSTNPGQWQQLREFGTPQSQAAFDKNLAQLRDRLLTANGYDYEKDIQPWIGKEASIALLAPTAAPNSAPATLPKPMAIVVLPIQNPLQAKQLLEKPRSQTAGKLVDRTYKGFQIKETQGKPENFSATVFDGKLLVVTTDPKAMDRAIDTYKGEQGQSALKATPGYTKALGKIQTAQSFGRLYLNYPAATAFSLANSSKAAAPNAAQLSQTQGVAANLSLESEGVRLKGITWYKPDSQKTYQVENRAKTMPGRLSSDTLVMASGGNLQQFWQNYSQGATAINLALPPVSPDWLQNALKSTINMDLDKDFLAWMNGEFSLAMVGVPEGSPTGLPFNLLLMVQSSDRRATEATLKQLDQTMAEKYKFKVEASKVGDQPITNWSLPAIGFSVTHGWLSDNVTFIALGSPNVPVVNAIVPKPSASLADSPVFKASVPSDPNPNNGNFFANLDLYKAKKLPLPQLPLGNQNAIDAIRSIGVTAAISDDRSTRYDVSLILQKAGKPAPLPSPTIPSSTAPSGNNPALEIPTVPSP